MKKLRVALCLSGLSRQYEVVYPSIVSNIMGVADVDTFLHIWDVEGSVVSWNPRKIDYTTVIDFQHIASLFDPQSMVIESFSARRAFFDPPLWERYRGTSYVLENILAMFYKVKGCDLLRQEHEMENGFKYDFVIRSRTDLEFSSALNPEEWKAGKIGIPSSQNFCDMNDQFAIGCSESMTKYSKIYDAIPELVNERGTDFHPETLLKKHLEVEGVEVYRLGRCDYEIQR